MQVIKIPKGLSWHETKTLQKSSIHGALNLKQDPASITEGAGWEGPCVWEGEGRVGASHTLPLESGESSDVVSSERNTKETFQCIIKNHRDNPSPSKSSQENRTHIRTSAEGIEYRELISEVLQELKTEKVRKPRDGPLQDATALPGGRAGATRGGGSVSRTFRGWTQKTVRESRSGEQTC